MRTQIFFIVVRAKYLLTTHKLCVTKLEVFTSIIMIVEKVLYFNSYYSAVYFN